MTGRPGDMHEPLRYRTTIKEWPAEERPREKLLMHGPEALTDAELLAILLHSGTRRQTALDIARELLAREGSLRAVVGRNPPELMRQKGIGPAKALTLAAAFELGRRAQASPDAQRPVMRTPEDVARVMIPRLRDHRVEVFVVLVLDARNSLKATLEISSGTLSASLVHPREVFKAAIDNVAASIILVHNHPSGDCEPSREDLDITRQLVEAGKTVGIPVHDHLIVGGGGFTSLAERGLI